VRSRESREGFMSWDNRHRLTAKRTFSWNVSNCSHDDTARERGEKYVSHLWLLALAPGPRYLCARRCCRPTAALYACLSGLMVAVRRLAVDRLGAAVSDGLVSMPPLILGTHIDAMLRHLLDVTRPCFDKCFWKGRREMDTWTTFHGGQIGRLRKASNP